MARGGAVVVWGNCQAAPLAALLREPLATVGLDVLDVPPVFEIDEPGLARVRDALRTAAVLVTHPVRDTYRLPGCGSEQLAALLPTGAAVVTVSTAYHVGPFPYLVNGHDHAGVRVDAPLTVYHDLRLVAAALGRPAPQPTPAAVRAVDAVSRAELRRREVGLHVQVAPLVVLPDALHCFNHPVNAVLADVARQVLAHLGVAGEVLVPTREFLGATRPPRDAVTAAALGWSARSSWHLGSREVSAEEVAAAHGAFYAARPDVATDTWDRYAERRALLGM